MKHKVLIQIEYIEDSLDCIEVFAEMLSETKAKLFTLLMISELQKQDGFSNFKQRVIVEEIRDDLN